MTAGTVYRRPGTLWQDRPNVMAFAQPSITLRRERCDELPRLLQSSPPERTAERRVVAVGGCSMRRRERLAAIFTGRVSRLLARRWLDLRVEGLEHVPPTGPAIIAARHFHWLYDGAVLVASVPRPCFFILGLDWVYGRRHRRFMTWLCGTVRWPVIFPADPPTSATPRRLGHRQLHRATREVTALLRGGNLFVIFPEGFATIDVVATPKSDERDFLPFAQGFARFAELAARDGRTVVPIVPAGLSYERAPGRRWRVVLRFAPPVYVGEGTDRDALIRSVEEQVRELSGLSPPPTVSESVARPN